MGGTIKAAKVKVRALLDDNGQVDFEVDGMKAQHARLKLDKDTGAHAIDFDLQDHTGRGLRFAQEDPIWVDEDAPCPPTAGISSDQLAVTGCQTSLLSTVNQNSGPGRDLRYQLNFVADDGSRFTCDPIIQNGGGGGGFR